MVDINFLIILEFIEFKLASFCEFDSISDEFPFDPGDKFLENYSGVEELFFPR